MATEIGTVRQNSYNNYSEGQERTARLNRRGELVVIDFWTQCVLDGRVFQMQGGTEDAPIDTTTSIDDQLVWMVVDGIVGWALIPCYLELHVATWTTSTIVLGMLEIDRGKVRYTSGGTAYVAENMRTDRPRASIAPSIYIGTDITVAAKTAVPGSMEIARRTFSEDAIGTAVGADMLGWRWSAQSAPPAVVVGVGSMLVHFGAATADATGYGTFMWVELPTESVT